MLVEPEILLKLHTTFHLGGPARFFIRAFSVQDIVEAIFFARSKRLPFLILGGGSNILVTEKGFNGVVIKIDLKGLSKQRSGYVVQAGEQWDSIVKDACDEKLWGVENLSGIPGTVGAAPVQNIGAYGVEVKDIIQWVEAYDTEKNILVKYTTKQCEFGYRTSVFKKNATRFIIVALAIELSPEGKANISYKDLAQVSSQREMQSPLDVRSEVLAIRARKFPDLSKEGTAGSFFLNPIISPVKAKELKELYPLLPTFDSEKGVKVSLAWLFEHVLHIKNLSVGGARVYEHQPLVIVTDKSAEARDVIALKEKISKMFNEKFGIILESEVRII